MSGSIKQLRIGIVGSQGKTGKLLVKSLLEHNFQRVVSFHRPSRPVEVSAGHSGTCANVPLDLEKFGVDKIKGLFEQVDVIVFVAGAGTQGIPKLFTVDIDGLSKCVEAAEGAGIKRFILTSVMNVEDRAFWWSLEGNMKSYFIAKRCADHELRRSRLNWTILQPGWLSLNNKPTGKIMPPTRIEEKRLAGYSMERADLAEVIVSCILHPQNTEMKSIPLAGGDTPIDEVIESL
ncbi:SDR family oxidoreductase KNAG_0A06450 [Huiozyma naganishii CBS 8797]|uniref:NAD(P)-binding domain-containing protein n=1 Tax=Huiozyma naganishii (strain ATCC MYA-139 / BCRC 22969 / CBS 8797 / KCTC 17520 / NBRC 10181 / NCYC 3082 / Yp74L-3) TaxID=1071383 RepID=J7RFH5_HUIN7|nr:hypothetical protein KNAG_0A06450 [Kazachstania naganishii CBS 8797]CCK68303.1 hypothetical protein KNAG_0A06450 [Kazachstania naganishii CBS 8797]